jgi:arylsulfatase A-like enzyme
MNAIVLSFDRLPVSFLACLGNNWIETPHFDRLAAQSACFHQHFAESLTDDTVRHAWWSGRYECRRTGEAPTCELLPAALAARGVTLRLLLETATPVDRSAQELSRLFPDCTELIAGADGLEVTPEDTPFLRLVARAQRDLRRLRTSRSEPWLLWIKSRGVPEPWLPPAEYARKFLDVDEDESADDEQLSESDDELEDSRDDDIDNQIDADDSGTLLEMSDSQFADLLSGASRLPPTRAEREAMSDFDRALTRKVLGGYLALLDDGLGRLLEAIDHSAAGEPTLLIVTAARGLTVHEAGVLRDEWGSSAEELVHVPLLIRTPGVPHGVRRQTLTQPVDLFPTLCDWFGLERPGTLEGETLLPTIRGEGAESSRLAYAADGRGLTAVRTADHYLVQRSAEPGAEAIPRLFAKPEDAWEVNELAAQSPHVVEELAGAGARFFGDPEFDNPNLGDQPGRADR